MTNPMKKSYLLSLLFSAAFACVPLPSAAQHLSEAAVVDKMYEAFALEKSKKNAEALEAFLEVGRNTVQQRSEAERQTYVISQTMACSCYRKLERYEEGYLLAKKLLQGSLTEKERTEIGALYAYNGYLYGSRYMKKASKDYPRARGIFEEVAPYADATVAKYLLPKIPLLHYFEGAEHEKQQEYGEAMACYRKAFEGFQKNGKKSDVISSLKSMASCLEYTEDFTGAVAELQRALVIAKSAGLSDIQMDILALLEKNYAQMGDDEAARQYALSMDSLVDVSSNESMKFAYYYARGTQAFQRKDYRTAERWLLSAKEMAEGTGICATAGNKNEVYTQLLSLYKLSQRFDEALEYAKKNIVEFQKITPRGDANYNMPYMSLAEIYRMKGDRQQCMAAVDRLFANIQQMQEPRQQASLYRLRGLCHSGFEEHEAALANYQKADAILAAKYPSADVERVMLMGLIAGMEHKMGRHADSETHYRAYAKNMAALYGDDDVKTLTAQIYLANAEGFAGHYEAGCNDYVAAAQRLREVLKRRIPLMGQSEREAFWSPLSMLLTNMTPYALKINQNQTSFTTACYDALVLSKAFLLDSERSLYDFLKQEGNAENLRDYRKLSLMKSQMKTLKEEGTASADSLLHLAKQTSHLEAQLATRCQGWRDKAAFMEADYQRVQQALAPGEVLIDFTDFVTKTNGRKYAAFVVQKNQKHPFLKPLFAESQMDSLNIVRPDFFYDEDFAPDVLKLLWEPLKGQVAEGATVYYVPSQLLFRVALESLPLADGSLLGDHYNFVRLSSARELLGRKQAPKTYAAKTAVVYGGLNYDMDLLAMQEKAKQYDLSGLLAERGGLLRGDSVYRDLPGTEKEARAIASSLRAEHWDVSLLSGNNGTEESFLRLHGRAPRLLHIATHGFYYTPLEAAKVDYLKGYDDAMLLSGLVFSGCNHAWLGKPLPGGVLSGILQAEDIARMDLRGTEMVVLSACQTGQGRATAEGLYGLQRAFKKAGVGTIVMSLWAVKDKATQDFMTAFYEHLLKNGAQSDKRKAFEAAKKVVREKYKEPYYWAAFVMLD